MNPAAPTPAPRPHPKNGGAVKRSLRIAVADDEVDMRDFFKKILPRLGHQVVCVAENGVQLISECRVAQPDLIITDLKMPGGDGLSAVEQIWKDQAVPVIMISAFPQDVTQRLSGNPLLVAVMVKPIKSVDLKPVIDRVISRLAGP
jgi:two-component system, response regulator PdtaR